MKSKALHLGALCLMLLIYCTHAATLYVDLNCASPTPPFSDWSTAATDIQSAIDASSDGDLILVTNGIYQTGGRVVYGSLTNRVVINKAVTVQSVNGSATTTIQGFPMADDTAVRCAYLTNNAVLNGFTLAFGGTRNAGDTNLEASGGGAWCESTNACFFNCTFLSNTASVYGGGIYSGYGSNCMWFGNSAAYGGAACFGAIFNSMIFSNRSQFGGGIYSNVANNCTLMFNEADSYGSAAYGCTISNCTIISNAFYNVFSGTAYPSRYALFGGGACYSTIISSTLAGNYANSFGGGAYFCMLTNCTLAGNSVDISHGYGGGAYGGVLNGCILYSNIAYYGGAAGALSVHTLVLANCKIRNNFASFGGGVAHLSYATNAYLTNCVVTGNVALLKGGGLFTCAAVDSIISSNSVIFQNTSFIFQPGGGGAYLCMLTNCTLAGNAVTQTNGSAVALYGGGAESCVLNCCVLTSNTVSATLPGGGFSIFGGGADSCTLNACTVNGNHASFGGGVQNSTMSDSIIASNSAISDGGAGSSTLNNCLITGNYSSSGGGVGTSTLTNCLLVNNYATNTGGGAAASTLVNCTVVSNYAGLFGGGTSNCITLNCVIYFNSCPAGTSNWVRGTFANCCAYPMPTNGIGNITNEPNFASPANGDFQLQSNSPCINAGTNIYIRAAIDLAGNPRTNGIAVDIGAYEYQGSTSILPYVWLLQYRLLTDGTADYADADGDGLSNYAEWKSGTDPTSSVSVLKIVSLTNNIFGRTIAWQSVSNITYYVQRSTSLSDVPPFTTIKSGIIGQNGITTNKDMNGLGPGPYFYRVGVQ